MSTDEWLVRRRQRPGHGRRRHRATRHPISPDSATAAEAPTARAMTSSEVIKRGGGLRGHQDLGSAGQRDGVGWAERTGVGGGQVQVVHEVGIQSAFLLDPAATSITVSWVSSWVNRKSSSGNSSRGFWVRATGPLRSSSQ
jgi:hypothetical protein